MDLAFAPDLRMSDGECLSGPDWTLRALHTPGHLGGHLCLALGDLLFSGDHVMGWSTSIVSPPDGDMAAYMTSLERLANSSWRRFFPGHGDPIDTPDARVEDLIAHRRQREGQVLAALEASPSRLPALTASIYHDIPAKLLPAAQRNVLAHLIDLATRNLVAAEPSLHPDALFSRR
jgi:hydroxyacylglutathione hydrolase